MENILILIGSNLSLFIMKLLYNHGMHGRPVEWRLNAIREVGFEVYALHIQYYKIKNSFEILRDYCIQQHIEVLVGHSHGGYLSYWLAEELGLPCLLVNPHLSIRLKQQMMPTLTQRACPLCLVALGTDDDIVDPERTVKFLHDDHPHHPEKRIKIQWLEGAGHSLDADYLHQMAKWLGEEIS